MRQLARLTGIPATSLSRAGIPLDVLDRPADAIVVALSWRAGHGDPRGIWVALIAAEQRLTLASRLVTVEGQHLVVDRMSDAVPVLALATGTVVVSAIGRWWWYATLGVDPLQQSEVP